MEKTDIEILQLLHPVVQQAIKKKWEKVKSFLPVQKDTIPFIISGKSCLIISPTAGGKTEAALFPVLSNIYESAIANPGVHAIFIAPLKALLNDLSVRIEEWLRYIEDISLFKWHGDVSAFQKNKQKMNPASILLTTPESLDVMLTSHSIDRSTYFKNVMAVIVDEAHYFAPDSRGAQLASSLERLQSISAQPFQRIGLSATVGDPDAVSNWLKGSGPECAIIKAAGKERNITIEDIFIDQDNEDYLSELQIALKELTVAGKTIIFGNSKKDVERTARLLDDSGVPTMVHHGSVSKILREETEEIMRDSIKDGVISATSTLELGIDIGDLNRVIQKGVLPSVNSYLQRIGRAGRKDGNAHIVLLTSEYEDFVLNIAMATLGSEGYFEPLRPSRNRYDILLQQLLLEILANYGISIDTFYNKVKEAFPYRQIKFKDFQILIEHWVQSGLIQHENNTILFGPVVEKKFSHKNYMELFATFDSNENYTVTNNDEEIGYLESWFVFSLHPEESIFQLAGRKWAVLEIINETKTIIVKSASNALLPEWKGSGGYNHIEYEVARRYQDIMEGSYDVTKEKKILPDALNTLHLYRKSIGHFPVKEGKISVSQRGKEIIVDTYAGSMINTILAFNLYDSFQGIKYSHNFIRIELKTGSKYKISEIVNSIKDFISQIMTITAEEWIIFLKKHLRNYKYSRFSDFIPDDYSVYHAAESYYNLENIQSFAALCRGDYIIYP